LGFEQQVKEDQSKDEINSSSTFSLHGLKALVTGASRGIGKEIAISLAEAGASVALNLKVFQVGFTPQIFRIIMKQ
jgi:hypothetical protein